jgi:hypothetical protein
MEVESFTGKNLGPISTVPEFVPNVCGIMGLPEEHLGRFCVLYNIMWTDR